MAVTIMDLDAFVAEQRQLHQLLQQQLAKQQKVFIDTLDGFIKNEYQSDMDMVTVAIPYNSMWKGADVEYITNEYEQAGWEVCEFRLPFNSVGAGCTINTLNRVSPGVLTLKKPAT